MVSGGETGTSVGRARMRGKEPGSNLALCAFSDQATPVPLRNYLPEHKVATAAEMGWSTLSNGELLDAAERIRFAGDDRSSIADPTKSVEAQDRYSGFALCKLAAAGTERRNNRVTSLNRALGGVCRDCIGVNSFSLHVEVPRRMAHVR